VTEQDAKQMQQYFSEVKKNLKSMSKNDLIRAIGGLLIEKKVLVEEINRLNGQNRNTNENVTNTSPAVAAE
jgi:hypothetical protein